MMQELEEITQVRNEAFYLSTAQKVDMIIKKFDENPHTQIRWIWELIQNAKDAPNKFGKVKIKQQISDQSFKSSHNGDAFNLKEIHSVATQYSTKQQRNDQNSRTTGKYGTGFITTHIIGRKVKISSILKYQKKIKKDPESNAESDSDQNSKVVKKSISKQEQKSVKSNKKYEKCSNIRNKSIEQQSAQGYKKEQSSSNSQEKRAFYYKKFDLKLDRSYNDRDQQLSKKIKKTQKRLTQIATQAKYETLYEKNRDLINYYQNQRNQNSYDTCFQYEIKDNTKFDIIERAVTNVKSLMGYSLLFNENLYEYKVLDKRNKPKNLSFSISKVSFIKIHKNIYLLKYKLSSQYDHASDQFKKNQFGYILAILHNGKAIAGIPIEVDGDNWTILKVDQSLSQTFKDFPLIGSSPTKWNAVINSDQFYPNEERSALILQNIDEGNRQKVQKNKENLIHCFQGVKDLYIYLARYDCQAGLSNLLIFDNQNSLTTHNLKLKVSLQKMISEIMKTSFIPVLKDEEVIKCKPKELTFISTSDYFKSSQIKKQISRQMNQSFQFLYKDKNFLLCDKYPEFYDVLHKNNSNYAFFEQTIEYLFLNDCLVQIKMIGFKTFQKMFQQGTFKKLKQIYYLLTKHELPIWNHQIFLNEENQFKSFQEHDKLMKKTISRVQEELLDMLGIRFRHLLIHPQFAKYFTKKLENKTFNKKLFESMIIQKFPTIQLAKFKENKQSNYNIMVQLYQLLITFNSLPSQSQNTLKHLKIFRRIDPLKFSSQMKRSQYLSDSTLQKLKIVFIEYLSYYFQSEIQQKNKLDNFYHENIVQINRENIHDYLKKLFNDPICGEKLSLIPIKLSMGLQFVQQQILLKLDEGVQLPNDNDIEIYDILNYYGINNRQLTLKKRIVLDIYPRDSLKNITSSTYIKIFNDIIQNYNSRQIYQKEKIIQYAKSIHESFTKAICVDKTIAEKYSLWKDFIDQRHVKLFQLKNSSDSFAHQEVKQFLYQLMNDPKKLKIEAQNYFKRNRNDQQLAEGSFKTKQSKKKMKSE